MKKTELSKLAFVAIALFALGSIANIQLVEFTSHEATGQISLANVEIASSMPSAVATLEIYCWGCRDYDICGHLPYGTTCCWDSWTGWHPCRS